MRMIQLFLVGVFLLILGGCTVRINHAEPERPILSSSNPSGQANKESGFHVQFPLKVDDHGVGDEALHTIDFTSIHYRWTSDRAWRAIQEPKQIHTYEEYIDYFIGTPQATEYTEDFFEDSSLIIYRRTEGSGSNSVQIQSLEVDSEHNLILHVERRVPQLGTMDMAYHGFIIEIAKPTQPYKEVKVELEQIYESFRNVRLTNETSKEELLTLLDEYRDQLTSITIDIRFQSTLSLEDYNEKVTSYGFEQWGDKALINHPYIYTSVLALNDEMIEKLFQVVQDEHIERVSVTIGYRINKGY